jgi:hypothetical protein
MAAQLGADGQVAGLPLYQSSATKTHNLGERFVTSDGRVFRYAKAGAVDLVAGNWIQSPAQLANHQNIAVAAAAIGATEITVTLGATAATANQYAGGQAVVTITPGLGQAINILGHPAAALSTTLVLTLAEPLRVALTTSTRIDLIPNPYNGVIQVPVTTLTGAVMGVATYIIPATEFGWLQRSGPAGALIAGTPGVGLGVGFPTSAAGAAVIDDAATAGFHTVGTMLSTGGNGECNGVMVMLE